MEEYLVPRGFNSSKQRPLAYKKTPHYPFPYYSSTNKNKGSGFPQRTPGHFCSILLPPTTWQDNGIVERQDGS
ncbi:hypothetical protein JTE90_001717 [Oedothorax gibbosus]|uniref:Uncharacterized protein n=1 Tax=Oedothorax gibbosus TaxID=931172 RepID=A0AAV6U1G2_9ARAC|nr:hypothetical protein JTE90_001717 [Oedothorax gibbosus]